MIVNWLKVGVVVAAISAVAYAAYIQRKIGADAERAKIERDNRDAWSKAEERGNDLRNCLDSGGLYHFETGKCSRLGGGNWSLPSRLTGENTFRPKQN